MVPSGSTPPHDEAKNQWEAGSGTKNLPLAVDCGTKNQPLVAGSESTLVLQNRFWSCSVHSFYYKIVCGIVQRPFFWSRTHHGLLVTARCGPMRVSRFFVARHGPVMGKSFHWLPRHACQAGPRITKYKNEGLSRALHGDGRRLWSCRVGGRCYVDDGFEGKFGQWLSGARLEASKQACKHASMQAGEKAEQL